MRRERRSAKEIVHDYANELLARGNDKDQAAKLLAVETIAFRMGWNDLYNRLRFRQRQAPAAQPQEREEQWWQK